MYFSAAASSENDQGSMNLASNTAPLASTRPSSVAAIHVWIGVPDPPLDVRDGLPGIALVPAPVEVLGDEPELDDQIAGQVLRLDLAALLPPQPDQGGFVVAHDDPGVRAADEATIDRLRHLRVSLCHTARMLNCGASSAASGSRMSRLAFCDRAVETDREAAVDASDDRWRADVQSLATRHSTMRETC